MDIKDARIHGDADRPVTAQDVWATDELTNLELLILIRH